MTLGSAVSSNSTDKFCHELTFVISPCEIAEQGGERVLEHDEVGPGPGLHPQGRKVFRGSFAFPLPGIKCCATSLRTSGMWKVSDRTREPEFQTISQCTTTSFGPQGVACESRLPYADGLHWRSANYETSVETPLGCSIDTYLPRCSLRSPVL